MRMTIVGVEQVNRVSKSRQHLGREVSAPRGSPALFRLTLRSRWHPVTSAVGAVPAHMHRWFGKSGMSSIHPKRPSPRAGSASHPPAGRIVEWPQRALRHDSLAGNLDLLGAAVNERSVHR